MTLQAANGPRWVSPDGLIEIRKGRWQDVLADVEVCDAVITDPPYSERTHAGVNAIAQDDLADLVARREIGYGHWSVEDVGDFVQRWSARCRGWIVGMTDHTLVPAYEAAFRAAGRYAFYPLPAIVRGSRVRITGDGPSCVTVQVMVSRPKTREMVTWGTLPGFYDGPAERGMVVVGGKPLWLMRDVVRDYTRPGDLVVDPFCGGATTAIACAALGRRCITSEVDPDTFRKAVKRCGGLTAEDARPGEIPDLFASRGQTHKEPNQ